MPGFLNVWADMPMMTSIAILFYRKNVFDHQVSLVTRRVSQRGEAMAPCSQTLGHST